MDRRETALKYLERLGPYIGGAIAISCVLIWPGQLAQRFAETGMSGKDAAGAIFNVMVTLTAFLFSVFLLAIAPGGGYIEKIFHTTTFKIFRRYVVEALVLGAVAALATMPFMSTQPPSGVWNGAGLAGIWIGISVTAALAFIRVVHIFIYWVGYEATHRRTKRA
jgi:hypothetical protein